MLIGAAGEEGRFVPNKARLNNLGFSIDVRQASASVEAEASSAAAHR